jgi:hypothetical protein
MRVCGWQEEGEAVKAKGREERTDVEMKRDLLV